MLKKFPDSLSLKLSDESESGAKDVCLVDFQMLELYSLQEHYITHYIRDYYVQIDGWEGEEQEVTGIYAPVLL